jgi:hypothetical protein
MISFSLSLFFWVLILISKEEALLLVSCLLKIEKKLLFKLIVSQGSTITCLLLANCFHLYRSSF